MPIAIIGGFRTPFTRIGTDQKNLSVIDLGVYPVNALVKTFHLESDPDGLLVFGSVMQNSFISNLSREIALESKLHPCTRAFSVIHACATSLNAVAEAANWIARGHTSWAIAGGSESMSNFPVSFSAEFASQLRDLKFSKTNKDKFSTLINFRPKHLLPHTPAVAERTTGLSMGEHCELMVKEWKISREDQDQWAIESHRKASHAIAFTQSSLVQTAKSSPKDNLIRGDSTFEKASKLKPAFKDDGTLTAANSSPLTDGGAAVLLADLDFAKSRGWPVLAIIDDFEMAAVDIRTEGLLMAPPYAILKILNRNKLKLSEFDILEIHEAFAAQVLCNLRALSDPVWCKNKVNLASTEIPTKDRINPLGGSIALGHPFGATGARMVTQLARQINENKLKSGIISICAAGGLGFVATLKSL